MMLILLCVYLNAGHEEVPAENVKGSTTADEQMETQVDSGNSGDLEAGLNENEEAVIEVNLEKSEKDEFASCEMDVEKQSETPVKQESKLSKKVCSVCCCICNS